jgi:hypothetical protein
MGMFDFLLSEAKKIKKNQRRLINRDAQPEDREISAQWLANNGSPNALLALLSRFDMTLDHQLKNQGEIEYIYSLAAHKGTAIVEPLQAWLRRCRQVGTPLRLYEEMAGHEPAVEMVYELLEKELAREDFKAIKKKKLLVWLAEVRHEGAIAAAAPFLEDFDEGVRYAAAEVIITQKDDAGRLPMLRALANPEEESNRVKVRVAEVFASRRWPVDDVEGVAERLPDGYAVRDGRIVSG